MNRKRNIIAVGMLTVVATFLFFWGLYYLLGNPFLAGGMDLVVAMENGAGLKRGDRVFLSGVDVGTVQEVDLAADGGVVVEVRVRDDLALPQDTRASVMGDVFGAHTVQLQPGTALLRLEDRDTVRGQSVPQITELAASLSAKAERVLTSADSLLSPGTLRNVYATTEILPQGAAELRAACAELRLAAVALRRTAEGVAGAETGQALTSTLNEVSRTAQALTSAAGTMERSLERSLGSWESVIAKLDRGQGTLGKMINDSSLYLELNNTLREMRMLTTDIRERPGRYISIRIF
jgi:phospholipid/cholesterol/gamma-HCH transport system substrate-binding protein